LQNGQDTKQADGKAIIDHGLAAKAYVDAVLNELNGLDASSAADRPALQYKLGQASAGQADLLFFINDARRHTITPSLKDEELTNALQTLNGKLAAIGAIAGELTTDDKQAIQALQTLYKKLKEQLSSFKLESGDKLVEMSVLTGGSWVDLGLALEKALVDAQVGAASSG
jgi:hypothetical protein